MRRIIVRGYSGGKATGARASVTPTTVAARLQSLRQRASTPLGLPRLEPIGRVSSSADDVEDVSSTTNLARAGRGKANRAGRGAAARSRSSAQEARPLSDAQRGAIARALASVHGLQLGYEDRRVVLPFLACLLSCAPHSGLGAASRRFFLQRAADDAIHALSLCEAWTLTRSGGSSRSHVARLYDETSRVSFFDVRKDSSHHDARCTPLALFRTLGVVCAAQTLKHSAAIKMARTRAALHRP